MKKVLLLSLLILTGCPKDAEVGDAIHDMKLSTTNIQADGQSTIDVSVVLSADASADRRNVIFKCTRGMFTTASKTEETVKALYIEGVLTAKNTWKTSLSPGDVTITVEPEFNSSTRDFRLSATITVTRSEAQTVTVDPSSFKVAPDLGSEVTITAKYVNANGASVSRGTKILSVDQLAGRA